MIDAIGRDWRELRDLDARRRAVRWVAEETSARPKGLTQTDGNRSATWSSTAQALLEAADVVRIFNCLTGSPGFGLRFGRSDPGPREDPRVVKRPGS